MTGAAVHTLASHPVLRIGLVVLVPGFSLDVLSLSDRFDWAGSGGNEEGRMKNEEREAPTFANCHPPCFILVRPPVACATHPFRVLFFFYGLFYFVLPGYFHRGIFNHR
jgi:hypothetical protein